MSNQYAVLTSSAWSDLSVDRMAMDNYQHLRSHRQLRIEIKQKSRGQCKGKTAGLTGAWSAWIQPPLGLTVRLLHFQIACLYTMQWLQMQLLVLPSQSQTALAMTIIKPLPFVINVSWWTTLQIALLVPPEAQHPLETWTPCAAYPDDRPCQLLLPSPCANQFSQGARQKGMTGHHFRHTQSYIHQTCFLAAKAPALLLLCSQVNCGLWSLQKCAPKPAQC